MNKKIYLKIEERISYLAKGANEMKKIKERILIMM